MKQKISAILGVVLIVIAIIINIYAGQIQYTQKNLLEGNRDEEGDMMRSNLRSAWLLSLSQILVFAGIGFILFEIAIRPQQETQKMKVIDATPP